MKLDEFEVFESRSKKKTIDCDTGKRANALKIYLHHGERGEPKKMDVSIIRNDTQAISVLISKSQAIIKRNISMAENANYSMKINTKYKRENTRISACANNCASVEKLTHTHPFHSHDGRTELESKWSERMRWQDRLWNCFNKQILNINNVR